MLKIKEEYADKLQEAYEWFNDQPKTDLQTLVDLVKDIPNNPELQDFYKKLVTMEYIVVFKTKPKIRYTEQELDIVRNMTATMEKLGVHQKNV